MVLLSLQIVGVLNMKDLLPFCQSSQLKVGTVAQLWQRSSQFRFALGGTRVMQLMIEMKNGVPIAMVVKFDEHRRDYIVMGLLTLEDVVEEVIDPCTLFPHERKICNTSNGSHFAKKPD